MRWKTLFNTLSKNTISNNDLHRLARQKGAQIDYAFMPAAQAVAVKYQDRFYIGLDYSVPENSAAERLMLAHELGHIQTNAFYGLRAPEAVRVYAEAEAERWAVKYLVPKKALTAALKQGLNEWELAEHFNVTPDFIRRAYQLYFEDGIR